MPLYYPTGGPSVLAPESVPSTIDVLGFPYVFTQGSPLTVREFIAGAKDRGLRLHRGELEQLHRRGALVPFYRIHRHAIGEGRDLSPERQHPFESPQLYAAARDGRLSDPSTRPFRQWPGPRSEASIYYSRYQLLGLRSLRLVLSGMKGRRGTDDGIVWELDPLDPNQRSAHERNRALAVVLEVLSPRYRPRVLGRVRSPEDGLWEVIDDHDPQTEAVALSPSDERLLRQAEGLLANAKMFDPLGKWHRVTRIANRHRWDELRNDALLAQEYRVAAEMILQFLEDQARHGRAKPLEPVSSSWHEPRHDRLTADQRERAETVMDFTLSDRPAVYLAMEGQTEVTILKKVLGLAGIESHSHWVSVVNRQNVDADVNLLARAIAVPRLDPEGHRGARILSPLSALIVVSDPEGRYRTDKSRGEVLAEMKKQVLESPPVVTHDGDGGGPRPPAARSYLERGVRIRPFLEQRTRQGAQVSGRTRRCPSGEGAPAKSCEMPGSQEQHPQCLERLASDPEQGRPRRSAVADPRETHPEPALAQADPDSGTRGGRLQNRE